MNRGLGVIQFEKSILKAIERLRSARTRSVRIRVIFSHFNSKDKFLWLPREERAKKWRLLACRRSQSSCSTSVPWRSCTSRNAGKRSRTSCAQVPLRWSDTRIRSSCRYVSDPRVYRPRRGARTFPLVPPSQLVRVYFTSRLSN